MIESEFEFTARENIYLLVKAARDKAEKLEPEAAKYLNNLLGNFTRFGHGRLDASQINGYLDTKNEINNLTRKFNRNIRDSDDGLSLSLEELDGVLEQDISRFLDSNEPNQKGMKFVRCNRAEMDIIMKYARNRATRKKATSRNSNKLAQNADLFKEVIIKRDENARLLGYANHATFRVERNIAKSPDWVVSFLDTLEMVLVPQGKQEMQLLLRRKKSFIARNTDYPQVYLDTMSKWDFRYYKRLVLEDMNIQYKKISEYFPLQYTILAMLRVFSSCL